MVVQEQAPISPSVIPYDFLIAARRMHAWRNQVDSSSEHNFSGCKVNLRKKKKLCIFDMFNGLSESMEGARREMV